MQKALIVSNSKKTISFVTELIQSAGIEQVSSVFTAGLARLMTIEIDYDVYIVDAPLPDENGEDLVEYLAEKNVSQVLMLVDAEYFDETSEKVESFGVIAIPKPVERATFWVSLKAAQALFKKMLSIQKQNTALQSKIEEIRIVDRAKCILIAHYSMNEEEAHKFIEKQAMSTRKSRRDIAEELINTQK